MKNWKRVGGRIQDPDPDQQLVLGDHIQEVDQGQDHALELPIAVLALDQRNEQDQDLDHLL